MKIDLAMLRGLEREREIPFEELASIIEQAIHTAYIKHEVNIGHAEPSDDEVRVTLDRKTGAISVLVPELNDAGEVIGEALADTEEFGRIGANAAKQVINQRLRDLGDDQVLGQFKDKEGHIVSGIVQQGPNPRMVHIDLGDLEAIMPPEEQVPGEEYKHGTRLRVYVTSVSKGLKGPQIVVSRTHPGLVRRLFELEVPELSAGIVEIVSLAREAGHRTKVAVRATQPGINAKGTCIGEMGRRVRAVMSELGEEDRHRRLLARTAEVCGKCALAVEGHRRVHAQRAAEAGARARTRLPAFACDRQGRPERSPCSKADGRKN